MEKKSYFNLTCNDEKIFNRFRVVSFLTTTLIAIAWEQTSTRSQSTVLTGLFCSFFLCLTYLLFSRLGFFHTSSSLLFLLTSSFLVVCYNTAVFTGRRRGTTRETGPWPSTAIKEEHRTTSRIRSPVRKTTKASWNRLLRYIWQWEDKSDLVYAVKILECFRVKIVSKDS